MQAIKNQEEAEEDRESIKEYDAIRPQVKFINCVMQSLFGPYVE